GKGGLIAAAERLNETTVVLERTEAGWLGLFSQSSGPDQPPRGVVLQRGAFRRQGIKTCLYYLAKRPGALV
ncbi:MAG: hypothetical protein AAB093_04555, partial [Nitrospirota bacterium]